MIIFTFLPALPSFFSLFTRVGNLYNKKALPLIQHNSIRYQVVAQDRNVFEFFSPYKISSSFECKFHNSVPLSLLLPFPRSLLPLSSLRQENKILLKAFVSTNFKTPPPLITLSFYSIQ